jgi:hypothetical protein
LTINASAARRVLLISKLGIEASVAALAEKEGMRLNEKSVATTRGDIGRGQLLRTELPSLLDACCQFTVQPFFFGQLVADQEA